MKMCGFMGRTAPHACWTLGSSLPLPALALDLRTRQRLVGGVRSTRLKGAQGGKELWLDAVL